MRTTPFRLFHDNRIHKGEKIRKKGIEAFAGLYSYTRPGRDQFL